jgi:indolepyruvate decarboxylase
MYKEVTAAATMLISAEIAPEEIDRVLYTCLYRQQPVYIGIPSDIVMQK